MVKISRDNDGKTRVAKGDKSGLGGQYAPDPAKIAASKNKIAEIPLLADSEVKVNDSTPKAVYEIWYTTYDYQTGVLGYAPTFDNKEEAEEWVKEFFANEEITSEIKRLEVLGVMKNPDGSFAGYVEEDNVLPSVKLEDKPSMSINDMVSLVKKEWNDAMSDDGRIWAKTNEELKAAKNLHPEVYEEAVKIARAETEESYRKAGLISSERTVTLVDGRQITINDPEITHVCGLCGEEYVGAGWNGYCDETLECAFDSGEHLIKL